MLRAYEKIKDRVMVNILFAGNGSDREVLQRFVEEHHLQNVYFLGFMNQSLLPQVYSVSDVLLLPSEFDPSPKVVNEAMNFGLPVIVSSGVGTAPDLVLRGKTGFQYPVGDIAELARLIELIVNNEELRKTLGRNAAQTVRQWNFSEGIKGVHSALSFITNNA